MPLLTSRIASLTAAAAGALALASCSPGAPSPDSSPDPDDAGALTVAAAFYPLQFVAERVGGDAVAIVALTPSGVEAHDVELSPATVRELGAADLALYLSDFQPAVDDAIATTGVDALDAATLVALHDAEVHGDDDADVGHEHGDSDPHFWLDPHLFAELATAVGDAFAVADPGHADLYTANAEALHADLEALEDAYAIGLAQCERDTIIVSHEAFGYLTEAFGLHQEGLAGLDPESEPSPARLLEIKDVITRTGATTIFTETLLGGDVAEALASDVGVTTAVLDPIENVADGDDYIEVMSRNLDALRTALGCG